MRGVSEPDYIKMLRFAYDLYVSDKAHFGATAGSEWVENEKIELNEKVGWIDIKNGVTIVNFRPLSLKNHVIKSLNNKDGANRYETSVSQWAKVGISNGTKRVDKKTKREELIKTIQIRTALDDRQYAIQIPLENFYLYLRLEDETDNPPVDPMEDNPDEGDNSVLPPGEFSAPMVSVASQPPSSSGGLNQEVSVTAEIHKNIIVHDGSSDLYNDLMSDLGDEF
jgi:hypothetical protein